MNKISQRLKTIAQTVARLIVEHPKGLAIAAVQVANLLVNVHVIAALSAQAETTITDAANLISLVLVALLSKDVRRIRAEREAAKVAAKVIKDVAPNGIKVGASKVQVSEELLVKTVELANKKGISAEDALALIFPGMSRTALVAVAARVAAEQKAQA